MTETTSHRVQLAEGNATVRRLMAEALEEAGIEVLAQDSQQIGDLLVVDVDSGIDELESIRESYAEDSRPVLVCGLRTSREHYEEPNWLDRPFPPDTFVSECRSLLMAADGAAVADIEYPGLHDDSTPETQRLSLEDAEALEEELGLEKGALSLPPRDADDLASGDEGAEFVEIDTSSSIVLDVDDLEEVEEDFSSGGSFLGELVREMLDTDELAWDEPQDDAPQPLRSPTLSQTMPDAPAAMAPDGVVEEDDEGSHPHAPVDEAPSSQGSVVELPPKLGRQVDSVSRLLADSWGRIGLAARPRDRAEHLQKVLRAIFSDGLSAAAAEVQRIPGGHGFSGSLGSMGLSDLLNTIRDRELRGRLEVSVGDDDFVLYVDAGELDGVENLSGDDDMVLLDILLEQDQIPHEVHGELDESRTDELAAPIPMQLRERQIVSPQALKQARRERALRLMRQLCGAEQGSFAFMNVEEGTGHAWPVDGIHAEVDVLLNEAMRGDSGIRTSGSADAHAEAYIPQGLGVDDSLPQTVEVPDPDEER